ncbi:MAG TPA: hypothetical protein VM618_00935, partial [Acidimicrobiia bacterium]|nr:hypothetical protein [Acidimicrobiia bacterium]
MRNRRVEETKDASADGGMTDGARPGLEPLQVDGPDLLISRFLRGYGPLVGFALLFLLMVAAVPTVDDGTSIGATGGGVAGAAADTSYVDPTSQDFAERAASTPTRAGGSSAAGATSGGADG